MIEHGVFLMVIGMTVTFVFLGVMILTVQGISRVVLKYFPESEESVDPPRVAAEEASVAVAVAAVAARSHKVRFQKSTS